MKIPPPSRWPRSVRYIGVYTLGSMVGEAIFFLHMNQWLSILLTLVCSVAVGVWSVRLMPTTEPYWKEPN